MEEPKDDKGHRIKFRVRRRERIKNSKPPLLQRPRRKLRRAVRDYGRVTLLALAVIISGLAVWAVLTYLVPIMNRPSQDIRRAR